MCAWWASAWARPSLAATTGTPAPPTTATPPPASASPARWRAPAMTETRAPAPTSAWTAPVRPPPWTATTATHAPWTAAALAPACRRRWTAMTATTAPWTPAYHPWAACTTRAAAAPASRRQTAARPSAAPSGSASAAGSVRRSPRAAMTTTPARWTPAQTRWAASTAPTTACPVTMGRPARKATSAPTAPARAARTAASRHGGEPRAQLLDRSAGGPRRAEWPLLAQGRRAAIPDLVRHGHAGGRLDARGGAHRRRARLHSCGRLGRPVGPGRRTNSHHRPERRAGLGASPFVFAEVMFELPLGVMVYSSSDPGGVGRHRHRRHQRGQRQQLRHCGRRQWRRHHRRPGRTAAAGQQGPALLGGNSASGFTVFLGTGSQFTGAFDQSATCQGLPFKGMYGGTWLARPPGTPRARSISVSLQSSAGDLRSTLPRDTDRCNRLLLRAYLTATAAETVTETAHGSRPTGDAHHVGPLALPPASTPWRTGYYLPALRRLNSHLKTAPIR